LNAKAFLKDEESVVIEQCDLNAARLAQTIEEFYHRSLQKKQSGFIRNRAVSQVENSRICLMNLIEERAS
jgi:UDP-N-acetylglucosamine:LPS N-acetylglucosamine transferase